MTKPDPKEKKPEPVPETDEEDDDLDDDQDDEDDEAEPATPKAFQDEHPPAKNTRKKSIRQEAAEESRRVYLRLW